jgi:hypothetical protein
MATDTSNLPRENQPVVDAPRTEQKPGKPASIRHIRLLGWGMIILSLLLLYLFIKMWPSGLDPAAKGSADQSISFLGTFFKERAPKIIISLDMRLVLMVMMAGGLGSFVHAATSFADYVGNERLTSNWLWFYVLRPFIGMTLAVIFYLVVRGGFLSAGNDAGKINPYGIAALACLVGMFSKQATDKLDELFTSLFRTEGDAKRKDSLLNPVPSVTDIEPQSVVPQTKELGVAVTGTGFVNGSVMRVGGINRETEFIDATKLKAELLPEDVDKEGEIEVTVFNPGPGGGVSTPIKLKVAPATVPGGDQPPPGGEAPPPGGEATAPDAELALTPEPDLSANPDDEDDESHLDEGEGPVVDETPDHELPPAKGGVA